MSEDREIQKCPLGPDMADLTTSTRVLLEKIDTLVSLHRDVIKWLLIVVCVIALGRSALDLGKSLMSQTAAAIAQEVK